MRAGLAAKELVTVVAIIFLIVAVNSWSSSKFQIDEMRGMTEEYVRRRCGEPSTINDRSKRHPEFYPDSTEVWWFYSGLIPGSRARVVFRDGVVTEVSTDHK